MKTVITKRINRLLLCVEVVVAVGGICLAIGGCGNKDGADATSAPSQIQTQASAPPSPVLAQQRSAQQQNSQMMARLMAQAATHQAPPQAAKTQ